MRTVSANGNLVEYVESLIEFVGARKSAIIPGVHYQPVTEAEYLCFKAAVFQGLNITKADKFFELEFGGLVPDWYCNYKSRRYPELYFDPYIAAKNEMMNRSRVFWSSGNVYISYVGDFLKGSPVGFNIVRALACEMALRDPTPDEVSVFWEWVPERSAILKPFVKTPALVAIRALGLARGLEGIKALDCYYSMGNQALSSIALCMAVNDWFFQWSRSVSSHKLFLCSDYFFKTMKQLHELVRRSESTRTPDVRVAGASYQQLMYLHLLVGRYDSATEGLEEDLYARTHLPAWTQAVYVNGVQSESMFEQVCQNVFDRISVSYADGIKQAGISGKDLIASVLQIGSDGSGKLKNNRIELASGDIEKIQVSKKAMLMVEPDRLSEALLSTPELKGRGINKYEAGRLRMLLPGPINHWVVESLALFAGEQSVYRNHDELWVQAGVGDQFIKLINDFTNIRNASSGNGVMVASDFVDHNILHTYKRMIALWNTMRLSLKMQPVVYSSNWNESTLSAIASQACRWVVASLDNASVQDPADKHRYLRTVHGLWTGWRSTTFINTIMNLCYQEVAKVHARNKYHVETDLSLRVSGDDMEGWIRSEFAGLRFLQSFDETGCLAKASKQLLSNTRTEFFRIMIGDGSFEGNMNRAISSMVSSDMQSPPYRCGREATNACTTQLATLLRRGADSKKIVRFANFLRSYHAVIVVREQRQGQEVVRRKKISQSIWKSVAPFGWGCFIPQIEVPNILIVKNKVAKSVEVDKIARPVKGAILLQHAFNDVLKFKGFPQLVTSADAKDLSDQILFGKKRKSREADFSVVGVKPLSQHSAPELVNEISAAFDLLLKNRFSSNITSKMIKNPADIVLDMLAAATGSGSSFRGAIAKLLKLGDPVSVLMQLAPTTISQNLPRVTPYFTRQGLNALLLSGKPPALVRSERFLNPEGRAFVDFTVHMCLTHWVSQHGPIADYATLEAVYNIADSVFDQVLEVNMNLASIVRA